MRVIEIAEHLKGDWEGNADLEITDVAPLESAGPSEIAFVGNRKAAASASQSPAGCLLVARDFPAGRTLIRVQEPRVAFAAVIAILHPPAPFALGIHPSAVIDPSAEIPNSVAIGPHATVGANARIGEGTQIGSGCSIGAGVRLGARCLLHANVTIYENVTIGDHAILHSGCVIGADGFGFVRNRDRYEKFPQIGSVEIGDDVEIGANSCIDRAALGLTQIGDGVKLDNLVHIGHNCRIGRHVVIAAQTGLSGGVVVEDYAVIGGQVGIGDKARIESGAVLGSGCGVLTSKIVRKGQIVWGTPARPLKEYLKQLANQARLPDLRSELARIQEQIAELNEDKTAT